MIPDDVTERQKRERHFARRIKAAKEGRHLPTLVELLRGFPFMGDSIAIDAQAFAERVMRRVSHKNPGQQDLLGKLGTITVAATKDDFREAAEAFRSAAKEKAFSNPPPEECALRCDFYAAALGCTASAYRVAAEAAARAYFYGTPDDEAVELTCAGVGWLLLAATELPTGQRNIFVGPSWKSSMIDETLELGTSLIERVLKEHDRHVALLNERLEKKAFRLREPSMITATAPTDEGAVAVPVRPDQVVVFTEFGNKETTEGKLSFKQYEKLIGAGLPVAAPPDLMVVKRVLTAEFPYADRVIETLLGDLYGRAQIRLQPTILVGLPGSGKTSFAKRFLETLAVPFATYSCGGVADSSMAGTARRFGTAEPSLPVSLIQRHRMASPGIILDEIEKAGDSRHNGNLLDALLGLLEPQSSSRWFDPYIEGHVNLSHVLWLATANSVDGLSAPLRDRCRIVEFPEPKLEHLGVLANRLLQRAVINRGLDKQWALPLDGEELDALRAFWTGGSIRQLARFVESILASRDLHPRVH